MDSFAALFEASISNGDSAKKGKSSGDRRRGHRDNAVIDIGGKSEGVIALHEFEPTPRVRTTVKAGDNIDVYIESRENDDGLVTFPRRRRTR